jgi:hypothetical protein
VSPARTPAHCRALALLASAVLLSAGGQDLGTLPLDTAQDRTDDDAVRLTVTAEREAYYVGETIRLRLVVDVERGFLETRMIQPFRRELDLPVQVQATWLTEEAAAPGGGPTLAFGGTIVRADSFEERSEGGEPRGVFGVTSVMRAERVGTLELEGPVMRFAFATSFRDDLLQGRVPIDRSEAFVRAEALALTILPLPEAGRPPGFTGAVGSFNVHATLDRHMVQVGESVRLRLVIAGDGNLEGFEAPRLKLEGFDLRGVLDEAASEGRVMTYDLAPTSETVAGVPPLPFWYFDPAPPAAYRVIETAWIPLDVRGPSTDGTETSASRDDDAPVPGDDQGNRALWVAGVGVALVAAAWVLLRARSRNREPG